MSIPDYRYLQLIAISIGGLDVNRIYLPIGTKEFFGQSKKSKSKWNFLSYRFCHKFFFLGFQLVLYGKQKEEKATSDQTIIRSTTVK